MLRNKMYIYRKVLLVVLVVFLPRIMAKSADNDHSSVSENLDELCGGYCYKIAKPFLQYAGSVKSVEHQFNDLSNANLELQSAIRAIGTQLEVRNTQSKQCLTKEEILKNIQEAIVNRNTTIDELSKELLEIKSKDVENGATIKQLKSKVDQMTAEIESKNNIIERVTTKLKNKESEILKLKHKETLGSNCIGKETGIYEIQVPGSSPFKVSCDSSLVDSGWTVIQRRQDGSENFNRTMKDYRSGFGNLTGEFFVGLDKLYLMTKSNRHELYIYLRSYKNEVRYARYDNFRVGGVEENFMIKSLGVYSGNAGDGLLQTLYMKFSTYDQDNDNIFGISCAKILKSSWWFNGCGHRGLNAIYHKSEGVTWRNWEFEPIQFVQMMIKARE